MKTILQWKNSMNSIGLGCYCICSVLEMAQRVYFQAINHVYSNNLGTICKYFACAKVRKKFISSTSTTQLLFVLISNYLTTINYYAYSSKFEFSCNLTPTNCWKFIPLIIVYTPFLSWLIIPRCEPQKLLFEKLKKI